MISEFAGYISSLPTKGKVLYFSLLLLGVMFLGLAIRIKRFSELFFILGMILILTYVYFTLVIVKIVILSS